MAIYFGGPERYTEALQSGKLPRPAEDSYRSRSYTNAMNNFVRILLRYWLFGDSKGSLEKAVLLKPGQKSAEWMESVVQKFCKLEEMVLDTCADKLGTANAC